jgi:ribosomal protein L30E
MDCPIQVLIVGKNESIVLLLKRLVNGFEGLQANEAFCEQSALDVVKCGETRLIIISSGLSEETETRIKENALVFNQGIKIITHFGGGSGLLKSEICEVLGKSIELKSFELNKAV